MILFVIMSCLSQISSQWHFIFPEILSIIFLYVASRPPGWKRWAQRELTRLVINAANSRSFISGLRLALLSSSLSPRLLCQSAALSFSSPPESPSSAPPPAPAAHHPAIPPPPAAITTSCQEKEPLSQCVCEWLCVCVCAEAIQEKKKKSRWQLCWVEKAVVRQLTLCDMTYGAGSQCRHVGVCVFTWISGLVTSSTMLLASSLDNKATAFSLSRTSHPFICTSNTAVVGGG